MDDAISLLREVYRRFNARDIDGVLAALTDDVAWANGMEGGHAHGHAAVRDYWTRQWAIVSPEVDPLAFDRAADGAIVVRVKQTIRDLDGHPIGEAQHGLRDRIVGHVFHMDGGKVSRFDIRDAA